MKDILKRDEELTKRIATTDTDIAGSITALVLANRNNRKLINWIIILTAFETLLAIAVIFVVIRTTNNSIRIQQTRNTLVNNCVVGNEFRATEKSFWNYILTIPPDQPPTSEQQQRIDAFKAKLDETFAARDCSKQ